MEMFPFSAIHYISGLDIWGGSKKKKWTSREMDAAFLA